MQQFHCQFDAAFNPHALRLPGRPPAVRIQACHWIADTAAFGLWVVCLVATSANQAEGADPTLNDIRSAVDRFTRTIERLQGTHVQTYQNSGKASRSNGAVVMEDLRVETDFKVDFVHGRTALVENRTWYYRNVSAEPFSAQGMLMRFNGETNYGLHTVPKHPPLEHSRAPQHAMPGAPFTLVVGGTDQTSTPHHIWYLAGLPCSGPNVTLAAVLNTKEARIGKKKVVDEVECVQLFATVSGWTIEAALDPNASWLPRRYQATRPGNGFKYEHSTTEFKQFPIAGSDESIWFPAQGSRLVLADVPTHVNLTLLDLAVNVPMAKEEFEIDIATLPDGVRVHGLPGVNYTGGRKDLFDAVDQEIAEESQQIKAIREKTLRQTAAQPESPVRVRSKSFWSAVPIVVAAVSLIALLFGVRLAVRVIRRKEW